MAHAEKCPVCHGTGKVPAGPWNLEHEQTCHGCGGKGWVEVQDEFPLFPTEPSQPII